MALSPFPRVFRNSKKSHGFHPVLERLEGREVPAGISVVYNTTQDWGSGFQGSFVIKNETSAPINNWKLDFDWGAGISSIWDASVSSHAGSHYMVTNAGWNGVIAAGGSVSFGLVGAPGAVAGAKPANYLVNGIPVGQTSPTTPLVSTADAKVTEGNSGTSSLVFPVTLSAPSTVPVTVAYTTAGITATAGSDFTQASGTITFSPGETAKSVVVMVAGDSIVEPDETLSLKLSSPTNATLGTATATGTIVNDDAMAGTGEVRFQVTSDWGTGYNGQVTITNQRAISMTGWTLSFDYDGTISSIWDAKVLSQVGTRWTVGSAGWNDTIPLNGSVSFGYGGVAGKTYPRPTNFLLANGTTPVPTPTPNPTPTPTPTPNQAPVAVADQALYIPGSPVTIRPLANDTDADGDKLSITAVGTASGGTVAINADGSVTYTPKAGFTGTDTFTYTLSDGQGHTANGSVTLAPMAQGASQWPAKAFAPYVDMTLWPTYDLASAAQSQGIRHFNLAFVVASPTNKAPCWGGQSSYGVDGGEFDTKVRGMVQQVRSLGGDVAVSFGGANGQELADAITDPVALKAAYLKVVEAYGLSRIDFDIEGAAVNNRAAIDRRSAVVAQLQADRAAAGKPLEVWFTLPVLPTGLTADGLYVVQSAAKAGVRLGGVNIMAMDYGDSAAPNPAGKMGDYAIQAATATQAQLRQAMPALTDAMAWAMIGVTPMIGLNDVTTEVFDQTEARELLAFAGQKGIGMLSMWSLTRDRQNAAGAVSYAEATSSSIVQSPFEFSKIFLAHESASLNPTPTPAPTPARAPAFGFHRLGQCR